MWINIFSIKLSHYIEPEIFLISFGEVEQSNQILNRPLPASESKKMYIKLFTFVISN